MHESAVAFRDALIFEGADLEVGEESVLVASEALVALEDAVGAGVRVAQAVVAATARVYPDLAHQSQLERGRRMVLVLNALASTPGPVVLHVKFPLGYGKGGAPKKR